MKVMDKFVKYKENSHGNQALIHLSHLNFLKKFKLYKKTYCIVHLLEELDRGVGATVVTVGLFSAALDGPNTDNCYHQIKYYCETHKTVNTENVYGMLLCSCLALLMSQHHIAKMMMMMMIVLPGYSQ